MLKKLLNTAITLLFCGALVLCAVTYLPGVISVSSTVGSRELPIYCVQTDKPQIAISFDAAWGNQDTAALLDILAKHQVKATFFMTGGWVSSYPDDVKKIYEAGHDLGNHSENHKYMTKLSDEEKTQELMSVHNKVKELTGYDMFLFRPPYGDYDNDVVKMPVPIITTPYSGMWILSTGRITALMISSKGSPKIPTWATAALSSAITVPNIPKTRWILSSPHCRTKAMNLSLSHSLSTKKITIWTMKVGRYRTERKTAYSHRNVLPADSQNTFYSLYAVFLSLLHRPPGPRFSMQTLYKIPGNLFILSAARLSTISLLNPGPWSLYRITSI